VTYCFLYFRGDEDEAAAVEQKLQHLEERANHLDKMRTATISSISYINDRNRKKNVEEAEKAIMVRQTLHLPSLDRRPVPNFKRRSCRRKFVPVKGRRLWTRSPGGTRNQEWCSRVEKITKMTKFSCLR